MKKALPLFVVLLLSLPLFSQQAAKWQANFEAQKVFIENKSQFDGLSSATGSPVLFATETGPAQILFTKIGLTYLLQQNIKKEKEEREYEKKKSFEEKEVENHGLITVTDAVHMQWLNSNPNVEIVTEEPVSFYYTYANVKHASAYRKLVYKNLYNGIDVEYVFHPQLGIEYSFILHPCADASQIKMKYSDVAKITGDENGWLHFPTRFGDIVDHAPYTFYEQSKNAIVSEFIKTGKTVSFKLGDYDNTQTVVIDPWTVTPNLPNAGTAFYIKADSAGNAYVFGGDNPIRLQKYDTAGALVWSYNTPWNTASVWFGAMVADRSGNCYITDGTGATCRKIDPTGGFVWSNSSTQPPADATEYWALALNCDHTQVMVAGSRHVPFSFSFNATVFKINMTNGAVASYKNVAHKPFTGTPAGISEVRSMCASPNGNYYYLTLDTVGAVDNNLNILLGRTTGYAFPYYMLYSSPSSSGQGQNNICANDQFIYTTDGGTLHKRDINTGAVLATATIPNASAHNNSGIAVDECGNVYVGAQTRVHKYDGNLTYISAATTPEPVYDISIGTNGDVLACGHGFAVALAMNACNQIQSACFTALAVNATGVNAFCNQCNGTATANVITGIAPYSYAWSNGETTQSINALCAGTYTVTITDANGSTGISNVTITQIGGGGSIALTSGPTLICAGDSTQLCAPSGYSSYLWNTGATTPCIQVKQAGNYYATVTDGGGCTSTSNHLAIAVHPQPPVSISVNGDTLTAYNAASYQWYLNGSQISGANSYFHIATQSGNYQVVVTDTNGCKAASNAIVLTVGIDELHTGAGINVYPNPLSTGNWNVEVTSEMLGSKVELFDAAGRLVYQSEIKNLKSQIDARIAKGVYLLRISSEQNTVSIKLNRL